MAEGLPRDPLAYLEDLPPVELDLSEDELAGVGTLADMAPAEDDALLYTLFARADFDRFEVTDELMAATLRRAGAVESLGREGLSEPPRHLRLVQGGKAKQAAPARPARRVRSGVQRFAVAAGIAAVALLGGLAYRLPTAYVSVQGSESTIWLGVNIFGQTVSATSEDVAGQKMLEDVNVRNMGYEDSLRTLFGTFDQADPTGVPVVSVEVSSAITGGQKDSLQDNASKLMNELAASAAASAAAETPAEPAKPAASESSSTAHADAANAAAEAEAAKADASAKPAESPLSPEVPASPVTPVTPATPVVPATPVAPAQPSAVTPVDPDSDEPVEEEPEDDTPAEELGPAEAPAETIGENSLPREDAPVDLPASQIGGEPEAPSTRTLDAMTNVLL